MTQAANAEATNNPLWCMHSNNATQRMRALHQPTNQPAGVDGSCRRVRPGPRLWGAAGEARLALAVVVRAGWLSVGSRADRLDACPVSSHSPS